MWHQNILGTIGHTPLVQLNQLTKHVPCTVLAKLEFFNPGGSVKDRIGYAMVQAAEESGLLLSGGTVVEATSGNTGAGIVQAARIKGYKCIFTATEKISQEKRDFLTAFGAELVLCPQDVTPEDPRSYYSVAQKIADETPGSVYLNQYYNKANVLAHYHSTGPEIWDQTNGKITHFFATASTGGTISGTAKYLKEKNEQIEVIGVDPYGSSYYKYFHEGVIDPDEVYSYLIEGAGKEYLAGNMHMKLLSDYTRATDQEAMLMTRQLAKEESIFAGQSSGLALAGALDWLEQHLSQINSDSLVVVLLPDSGSKYISKTYNDDWMKSNKFL
ncbi:MAG: cysteine synthase family protein [Bacteroidetes bacterium]|nr:cysteine synthase family protein [Bacteroidota bacterium]